VTAVTDDFERRYSQSFSVYLEDDDAAGESGESALLNALELGRTALTEGPSLLEILAMHYRLVFAGERGALSAAEIRRRLARGDEFLAQLLAPFEMTRRGWNDMVARLRRMNETLEQKVAERTAALRESEHRFVQAQKMEAVGSLTGGLAHDFNNLLGIIIANLDLLHPLLREMGEAAEFVEEALGAAMRGADLTRRLLAFARRQPLQPEPVKLNELVGGLAKLLDRTLGEHIEIELRLAPEVWPVVVDPSQLEAAITNLATNARDAMPKGGRITIATMNGRLDAAYAAQHADVEPGDYAMIELSDTGSGMPPDIIGRIFEPFFTTKERGKGTGLGLSMVFGFIKQSGGHIDVSSEPAKGTAFRLFLPRGRETQHVARSGASEAAVPHGQGETVLVVDDNHKIRSVVAKQLTQLGYRVVEAENAVAALALLETPERVHLLFTDVVMPGGMDGFDLARTASERRPSLKILLTSGFPEGYGETKNLRSGFRLLAKPYRRLDLARAVRETLDGADQAG